MSGPRAGAGLLLGALLLAPSLAPPARGAEATDRPAAESDSAAAERESARAAALEAIQRARRRAGLPELARHAALERAAQAQSDALAANGDFSHRGRDGRGPAERVEEAGYGPLSAVGEALAHGMEAPELVVERWLESPPHREILLDSHFSEIGLGVAAVRGGRPGHRIWVALVAAPALAPDAPRADGPRVGSR